MSRAHPIQPRLFSLEDASAYLGVSRTTVKRYVEAGRLKTFRLPDPRGGDFLDRTLIKVEELNRLIEAGVDI